MPLKRYGGIWPDTYSELSIEQIALSQTLMGTFPGTALAPHRHFKKISDVLWPVKGGKPLTWHPWKDWRIRSLCENKVSAWTGAGACGKAQPLDSVVFTPSGPKRMGDVAIGDEVCTPDGSSAVVSGVFPQGEKEIFKIGFSDGTFAECCKEHLWLVGHYSNHWKNKVVDTQFLIDRFNPNPNRRPEIFIKTTLPVKFNSRDIKMPPYLIGVLLGDGTLGGSCGKASLGLASIESEIIDEVRNLIGDEYALKKCFRSCDYRITKASGLNNGRNKHIQALKDYGLWGKKSESKFIPEDYLYNTADVRIEVLRGLMDTDGFVGKNGGVKFYSISKSLVDGVRSLVESLGGTISVSHKKPKYTHKGEIRSGQICFCCSIQISNPAEIFRVLRKKERTKVRKFGGKTRTITSIVPVGKKQAQCIMVNHPDHLYLTNHFIPTHNTFDAAHFAMLYWSCDPLNTAVILTSTTGKMVRKRIWPVIQQLYHDSPGFPGNMVDSKTTLQATKGDDKHGIFAMAVADGPVSKAVANIQGIHAKRMLVIIDEATDTPEAIFEAIANLRKGCSDFRLLVIGNALSHLDPHGIMCEPKDGWGSVTVDDEEWETIGVDKWEIEPGVCLHFDGLKSPNVKLGEDKWPFLFTNKDLQRALNTKDATETIGFWKYTRGFWAPEGLCKTVFSDALITRHDGRGKFTFVSSAVHIAMLDPAFGGDKCKLKFGRIGDLMTGKQGLQLDDGLEIKLKATSKEAVHYQIANRVIEECIKRGIEPSHFALDASGEGGGLASIIAREWGTKIKRTVNIVWVEFGGSPSEMPVSYEDVRMAKDVYDRKVTELYFSAREMMMNGQLKGLDRDECLQFCAREYNDEKRKIVLDTKKECKEKIGRSPDDADAVVVGVELARRLGVNLAGKTEESANEEWDQFQKQANAVFENANYGAEEAA